MVSVILMPEKEEFYAFKKGEEAREELKNKALKFAYEIAAEIGKTTKIKLAFEPNLLLHEI